MRGCSPGQIDDMRHCRFSPGHSIKFSSNDKAMPGLWVHTWQLKKRGVLQRYLFASAGLGTLLSTTSTDLYSWQHRLGTAPLCNSNFIAEWAPAPDPPGKARVYPAVLKRGYWEKLRVPVSVPVQLTDADLCAAAIAWRSRSSELLQQNRALRKHLLRCLLLPQWSTGTLTCRRPCSRRGAGCATHL